MFIWRKGWVSVTLTPSIIRRDIISFPPQMDEFPWSLLSHPLTCCWSSLFSGETGFPSSVLLYELQNFKSRALLWHVMEEVFFASPDFFLSYLTISLLQAVFHFHVGTEHVLNIVVQLLNKTQLAMIMKSTPPLLYSHCPTRKWEAVSFFSWQNLPI